MSDKFPPFVDLGALPEDERIEAIGLQVLQGKTVGFLVDDPAKARRYVRLLRARFPGIIVEKAQASIAGTVMVQVRHPLV